MNKNLAKLQPYPFEKLARLKDGIEPPAELSPILLSIGEPKHKAPGFIAATLVENLGGLSVYPTIAGMPELRSTIGKWISQRFKVRASDIDIERHVLPVTGTREALFAFAQCVVDGGDDALVLTPNPFYQIYEGAAFLAGAEPYYVAIGENGLPEFETIPDDVWSRCQLLYLCSPGNPTGAVIPADTLKHLIGLADKFDFVIASDECYSEIYFDESKPPVGLLQVAAELERKDFERCVVFHSLSKRSSVPGLRSGFVAGDGHVLTKFRHFRTYHGCSMPPPTQHASISAWSDETHVIENRALYKKKFEEVTKILSEVTAVTMPDGAFYLWLATPVDDETFARELFRRAHITVLPGSYLSREINGRNPGAGRVRVALVAPLAECIEAAKRIRDVIIALKEK